MKRTILELANETKKIESLTRGRLTVLQWRKEGKDGERISVKVDKMNEKTVNVEEEKRKKGKDHVAKVR